MLFWLYALGLTLVITLFCFSPLLRGKKTNHNVQRDQLNKAFYLHRLSEIKHEQDQGLIDDSPHVEYELQRALLDDIPSKKSAVQSFPKSLGFLWVATGFLVILVIATLCYLPIGSWQSEFMLEKTYAKLPYFYQRLEQEQTHPLTQDEMEQFAIALRLHLQKHPKEAQSWWLLGQIGMASEKGQLALESYAKAYQLIPNNLEYKLSYARILMFSEDAFDRNQGEVLLKEVVRQDHTNLQALSLLAFHYFEKEEYKLAIISWAMMLKMLPEKDSRRNLIEKSIQSARDAQKALEASHKKP